MPNKTMSLNGQASKGTKTLNERWTVVLACSANGEKVKSVHTCISKLQKHRCFKNIKNLANDNAWITNSFMKWLNELNNEMKNKQKINSLIFKILQHEQQKLSNVTLKSLPSNTTLHLQPLYQEIL